MTFELVSGMFRINCSVKTRKLRTKPPEIKKVSVLCRLQSSTDIL